MTAHRDNFSETTKAKIGKAAMYICANPECLRFTGYETTEGKPRALAEAAHVIAASNNGPRATKKTKDDPLDSPNNGIWLCLTCHKRIDADVHAYPKSKLQNWKKQQSDIVRRIAGKDLEAALISLGKQKQHHQECQNLLSFLENRRVFYEGFDSEFPPRVLDSLSLVRTRVIETRAMLSPDSHAFNALQRIQMVIDTFLREIGPSTDLRSLRCNSNDPIWMKFASELTKLRTGIGIIMKVIAQDIDYKLTWV